MSNAQQGTPPEHDRQRAADAIAAIEDALEGASQTVRNFALSFLLREELADAPPGPRAYTLSYAAGDAPDVLLAKRDAALLFDETLRAVIERAVDPGRADAIADDFADWFREAHGGQINNMTLIAALAMMMRRGLDEDKALNRLLDTPAKKAAARQVFADYVAGIITANARVPK